MGAARHLRRVGMAIVGVAVLGMSGCDKAKERTPDDAATREGARHAKQLQMEQRLRDALLDPASMQMRNARLNASGTALCAEINGKNKEGFYVGFRRVVVMDNLISFDQDPDDTYRQPEHKFPAIATLTGCF